MREMIEFDAKGNWDGVMKIPSRLLQPLPPKNGSAYSLPKLPMSKPNTSPLGAMMAFCWDKKRPT
jgi:hypothetical protein